MIKRPIFFALCTFTALTNMITPLPVAAQSYGTDAAIGAAAGAIAGALLFDNNRRQYYYQDGGRPVYVSNGYARSYYRRHDPGFYHAHRGDFAHHGDRFANDWQHNHR